MKQTPTALNFLDAANETQTAIMWLPQVETQSEFLTRAKNEGYEFVLRVLSTTYVNQSLIASTKDRIVDCMTAIGNDFARLHTIEDALLIYK